MTCPLPPFKPKLLVFDMDGTLLDPQHQINAETEKALQRLSQSGIPFILATGRHFRDARPFFAQLHGCASGVFCNGGALWLGGDDLQFHGALHASVIREGLVAARAFQSAMFVCANDGEIYSEPSAAEMIIKMIKNVNIFHFAAGDVDRLLEKLEKDCNLKAYKISFLGPAETLPDLERAVAEAARRSQVPITTAFGLRYLLDVQPHGTSKADGTQRLLQKFGLSGPEHVVCIGDGMNDKEMIDWAGFGLAMGNGFDALKEAADGVLPSHTENGLAQFIHALLDRDVA